jgi:hypothetical protein
MSRFREIASCLLIAAGLAGCSEAVTVHVKCVTTAAATVECDVVQKVGKTEAEVCWDFAVTCANGAEVKAERTCQKVKDGASTKVVIPTEKLTGLDKCGGDGAPVARLSGTTLNGQPFEMTPL